MTTQGKSYSSKSDQNQTIILILTWLEVRFWCAQAQITSGSQKPWYKKALQFLTGLVLANSKDARGTALCAEHRLRVSCRTAKRPGILERHSQGTASLLSSSSLVESFTNNSQRCFAFKDIDALAWIITLATNWLIQNFTNSIIPAILLRNTS